MMNERCPGVLSALEGVQIQSSTESKLKRFCQHLVQSISNFSSEGPVLAHGKEVLPQGSGVKMEYRTAA